MKKCALSPLLNHQILKYPENNKKKNNNEAFESIPS